MSANATASVASRLLRLLRYWGPPSRLNSPKVDDACRREVEQLPHLAFGTRQLVLLDFQNIPSWLDTMNKMDFDHQTHGRFIKSGAVMVAFCEPGIWRRRLVWSKLPWVMAAKRRNRLAFVPVDGGDEAGDLALCIALAYASMLDDYRHVFVVTDDRQMSSRLRLLHGRAFLTVVNPSGEDKNNNDVQAMCELHDAAASALLSELVCSSGSLSEN